MMVIIAGTKREVKSQCCGVKKLFKVEADYPKPFFKQTNFYFNHRFVILTMPTKAIESDKTLYVSL